MSGDARPSPPVYRASVGRQADIRYLTLNTQRWAAVKQMDEEVKRHSEILLSVAPVEKPTLQTPSTTLF
jgi:hypothetical protein